jgi:hypothetical protein
MLRYRMTSVRPRGGVLSTGGVSVMHGWTWPEGHGESSRITAGTDARLKAAVAVCLVEQWCAAIHQASWPGSLALFPC